MDRINGAKLISEKVDAEKRVYPKRYAYERGSFHSIVIRNDRFPGYIKLSEIFDQMPYGLIDKRVTGIGATHLEIHTKRSSIIVLPNRALAQSKYNSAVKENLNDFLFYYVGGGNSDDGKKNIKDRFKESWDADAERREIGGCYSKILVVSDSLKSVLDVTETERRKESFFLMIDEMDSYQIDSVFRSALAEVIDVYFMWPPEKRAMVSATFRHEIIYYPEESIEETVLPPDYDETEEERSRRLEMEEWGEEWRSSQECDFPEDYHPEEYYPEEGIEETVLPPDYDETEEERSRRLEMEEWGEEWRSSQDFDMPEDFSQLEEVPHSSMAAIMNEAWVQISYKVPSQRAISLKHTNCPNECLVKTLFGFIDNLTNPTILVAYNSLQDIEWCINHLKVKGGVECKVLFSENNSNEQLEEYRLKLEINNNCLRVIKNGDTPLVVFMTCAFFVGVDILDEGVHLIMVADAEKPHTLLSVERIDQICGRLRKGAKSQTIIYSSTKGASEITGTAEGYEEYLLNKAEGLRTLSEDVDNRIKAYLGENTGDYSKEMKRIVDALDKIVMGEIGKGRAPLIRQDIHSNWVIYYLNLDAIVDEWKTKNIVYRNRSSLRDNLREFFGPSLTIEKDESLDFEVAGKPKNNEKLEDRWKKKIIGLFESIPSKSSLDEVKTVFKRQRIEWDMTKVDRKNPKVNESIMAHAIITFFDILPSESIKELFLNYLEKNKLKVRKENTINFYRSLAFMLLDDNDPFKKEVLEAFANEEDKASDKKISLHLDKSISLKTFNASQIMVNVMSHFTGEKVKDKEDEIGTLYKCFFELSEHKGGKNDKPSITGLYSKAFKSPDSKSLLVPPKGSFIINAENQVGMMEYLLLDD